MQLIRNFPTCTDHVECETLKGHVLDRMLIYVAGTEQRTIDQIASYDPAAGRINFRSNNGGAYCIVLVID